MVPFCHKYWTVPKGLPLGHLGPTLVTFGGFLKMKSFDFFLPSYGILVHYIMTYLRAGLRGLDRILIFSGVANFDR